MELWPHQMYAIAAVIEAVTAGERRICLTSPTGGGKTAIAEALSAHFLREGHGVSLYANRKLLIEQIGRGLTARGFDFGVRAAGYQPERDKPFQVSSIQTEHARCIKRNKWSLHQARLVLIDECHLQKSESARKIIDRHVNDGATVLGITATPLDLGDIYDRLIVAGTNSELRKCGALVPAVHYGCDEPDLGDIGPKALAALAAGEDLSEKENAKAIMAPGVHARVLEWFRRLNPQAKPTILFAPGVRESIWFAEQFTAHGVRAAHIDGEQIWMDGITEPSTQARREEILELSRTGEVKVLCNRFVLREGIDAPWLAHGIFATVFGSLASYLQSGGRLLRAHPSLQQVTVQDHGGNWWRHGSLNQDRQWQIGLTSRIAAGLRIDRMTDDHDGPPPDPTPFTCPSCRMTLVYREIVNGLSGKCPGCGHQLDFRKRSRPVIQSDGTLTLHTGDGFVRRKTRTNPDTQKLWERVYWRAFKSKKRMTFNEARGLFCHEHGYFPPKNLKLMPRSLQDWYMPVATITKEQLR